MQRPCVKLQPPLESLWRAYYYFDSKNAIVLAFYQKAQDEMAPGLDRDLPLRALWKRACAA